MSCYRPITGYVSREVNKTGKRSIVFDIKKGYMDLKVDLPCGSCEGCKMDYSKSWAGRCICEAQLYQDNCFITLTYNDEHLPDSMESWKRSFQLFMKRLRIAYPDKRIRYFCCGETGALGRKHLHACLFNIDFDDIEEKVYENGKKYYSSKKLEDLWSDKNGLIGYVQVGDLNYFSARYVAQYVMKKLKGDKKDQFGVMSLKPGIGSTWFEMYYTDLLADGMLCMDNGMSVKIPKYFKEKLKLLNIKSYDKLIAERRSDIRKSKLYDKRNMLQREKSRIVINESKRRSRVL